jgi:hypothetical protein
MFLLSLVISGRTLGILSLLSSLSLLQKWKYFFNFVVTTTANAADTKDLRLKTSKDVPVVVYNIHYKVK